MGKKEVLLSFCRAILYQAFLLQWREIIFIKKPPALEEQNLIVEGLIPRSVLRTFSSISRCLQGVALLKEMLAHSGGVGQVLAE